MGIRYFRHAEIQQESSLPAMLTTSAVYACLIARATLNTSIKYAIPQKADSYCFASAESVGELPQYN